MIFIRPSFANAKSIEFNGSTQDVRLPNDCFNAQADGAIIVDIYVHSLASNQQIFTVSIGTSTTDYLALGINTSGRVNIQSRTGNVNRFIGECTTTTLSTGQWYQVIWSKYGTDHKIRINGVNQTISYSVSTNLDIWFAHVAAAGTMLYTLGQFRRNTSVNFVNGYMDEVAFLPLSAQMTSAELLEFWNGGLAFDYRTHSTKGASIVSYYRHGDNVADVYPTSKDIVGSNNGAMTNMSAANFVSQARP